MDFRERQTTADYMKNKGVGELFEAMMTALMVHQPGDHFHFLRRCLEMSEVIPHPISWNAFLTLKTSDECLSPFSSQSSRRVSLSDDSHLQQPIIFLLSSTGTLTLSARLLERYNRLIYLSIDENADERFLSVQRAIEQHRSSGNAFLLAGDLNEALSLDRWNDELGRLDAVLLLSAFNIYSEDDRIIRIDVNEDFENILRRSISIVDHSMDEIPDLERAREYLAERNINELFEALMTGLMVEKPEDHLQFLIESLKKSPRGTDALKWNAFIQKKGGFFNSLPPINNETSTTMTVVDLFPGKPILFVTGGPKSGKKTQCDRLAERYGLTHISFGELIQSSVDDHSPTDVLNLLKSTMEEKAPHCRGFLISGFPQRLDQAREFESSIGRCRALIYLDVPDPILSKRLMHRGQNDTIEERLSKFHSEMKPLLDSYSQHDRLIKIDGQREINEISDTLTRSMETFHVVLPSHVDWNKFQSKKFIFLVGGPGSEKNKQGQKIVDQYGFTYLRIGDVLRRAAEKDDVYGEQVNRYLVKGQLVPMDLVHHFLCEFLMSIVDRSNTIVVDGYPRNVSQARAFEHFTSQCHLVIYVKKSRQSMSDRLTSRCLDSGRVDDQQTTIDHRLKIFHNQTLSVLDFFERKNKSIVDIDLDLPDEDNFNEVKGQLDQLH